MKLHATALLKDSPALLLYLLDVVDQAIGLAELVARATGGSEGRCCSFRLGRVPGLRSLGSSSDAVGDLLSEKSGDLRTARVKKPYISLVEDTVRVMVRTSLLLLRAFPHVWLQFKVHLRNLDGLKRRFGTFRRVILILILLTA